MNDYLSNLVAQSFNRIEVLQPRPASLFEPLHWTRETIVEQSLELERDDRAFQSPRTSPSSLPSQLLELGSPFQPQTADLPQSIANQTVAEDVAPPISFEQQRPTPKPTTQRILIERVTEPVEPLLERTSPYPSSPVIQPQIVPLSERSPHLTSPLNQSQIVPLPESASMPTAKTEAPTIQVTIGRVDVRAIAPPTSPRQTPKPSVPNLSLEDYLKSRSGGRG